jgi:predicted P-loop ATPase
MNFEKKMPRSSGQDRGKLIAGGDRSGAVRDDPRSEATYSPSAGRQPEVVEGPESKNEGRHLDVREAVAFLTALRAPPWALTAIDPENGKIETVAIDNAQQVETFLLRHAASRNIYYSVNPLKSAIDKKAKKSDIASIEYLHADFDPADGETPEAAKRRYLEALRNFDHQTWSVVDSGNGIQALWKLSQPVQIDGEETIVDVELRLLQILRQFGSATGTQDICRIMRLPGTTNFPTKKKLREGRSVSPATLISLQVDNVVDLEDFLPAENLEPPKSDDQDDVKIDWDEVERYAGWLNSIDDLPENFHPKGKIIVAHSGTLKELCDEIRIQGYVLDKNYESWSRVTLALAGIFKAHGGFAIEQIAAALMCNLRCNTHVTSQTSVEAKRRAVYRALTRSRPASGAAGALPWREKLQSGFPRATIFNTRLALSALGAEFSCDTFHHKLLLSCDGDQDKEMKSLVGIVSDDIILALRQIISERFKVDFGEQPIRDGVKSLGFEHRFDPVLDMINEAEANWDKQKRLDTMAVEYFNAEDTPLNRAMVKIWMIAATRRVRRPGCKFDNILTLESKEGWMKSTALRTLAGDENFSDQSIFGKNSREVQEQLSATWIHENSDLSGLKRSEVEHVKAFASRQEDIARPAYGHFVENQPRHSVECGTTNSSEYLESQTGNRRFWPIKITSSINIEKLKKDRLQLIGEAAFLERKGESTVLDESLWPDAEVAQEQRRVRHPWEETLADTPETVMTGSEEHQERVQIIHTENYSDGGLRERVNSADILTHVLKIPLDRQHPGHSRKVAEIMEREGWERTRESIGGKQVRCYVRPKPEGDPPL